MVNEPLTVALTFKPSRADGLLMLLTTNNYSSNAIFAAGLRNGRVLIILTLSFDTKCMTIHSMVHYCRFMYQI